ncbi:MAG: hypothetical protein J1F11_05795 [Oscillospiraceae bacterium]|nr:hypothetical protein [Oscillospiraceae bacterium]
MTYLALLGGLYLIITGIIGKGKAFRSKIGTPLSEKEARTVRITYIIVGVILLAVAVVSGIELFFGT